MFYFTYDDADEEEYYKGMEEQYYKDMEKEYEKYCEKLNLEYLASLEHGKEMQSSQVSSYEYEL